MLCVRMYQRSILNIIFATDGCHWLVAVRRSTRTNTLNSFLFYFLLLNYIFNLCTRLAYQRILFPAMPWLLSIDFIHNFASQNQRSEQTKETKKQSQGPHRQFEHLSRVKSYIIYYLSIILNKHIPRNSQIIKWIIMNNKNSNNNNHNNNNSTHETKERKKSEIKKNNERKESCGCDGSAHWTQCDSR